MYRGCLVDFRIFLDNVDIPVSVQFDKLHSTILRIIIWSYHPEYLVKRGAAAVGLMLDSPWNLAGALTGFEFDSVYFQHFCKSPRSTALFTLIGDAYTESIDEEPRRFESISEGVHLWLQAQDLDSQEAPDKLKTPPSETVTKVALRQMSRLGRAMQDTVEVQPERQEVAIHGHLHRAPNAAKAQARDMRVWCRKCRSDITKRINRKFL